MSFFGTACLVLYYLVCPVKHKCPVLGIEPQVLLKCSVLLKLALYYLTFYRMSERHSPSLSLSLSTFPPPHISFQNCRLKRCISNNMHIIFQQFCVSPSLVPTGWMAWCVHGRGGEEMSKKRQNSQQFENLCSTSFPPMSVYLPLPPHMVSAFLLSER